jgi:hypothetical protein
MPLLFRQFAFFVYPYLSSFDVCIRTHVHSISVVAGLHAGVFFLSWSRRLMKIILFGATGMIGQGVLRECLLDPGVDVVLSVSRSSLHQQHAKLQELVTPNLADLNAFASQLTGFDACFYSLGASAAGMNEENYRRINYDLPLAVANLLVKLNPQMTFIYVSGRGTDSTEKGRSMWARVKGQTENALLRLPFKAAYMFRIGAVLPLHGIKSKTSLYNLFYAVGTPLMLLIRKFSPQYVQTTEEVGKAMVIAAKRGAPKPVLETSDIFQLLNS